MRFTDAIEEYLTEQAGRGRINSAATVAYYQRVLVAHAEDAANRDPRKTGREDVKRTLRRWNTPNSQRVAHSVLASFYAWCCTEGLRKDNPAQQVQRARSRPVNTYRLSRDEVAAMFDACATTIEQRVVVLGACAGLRNAELRGLRGEHFTREGWIYVAPETSKGNKSRWIPVLPDAHSVVGNILDSCALEHYVIPSQRPNKPPKFKTDPLKPCSPQTIRNVVNTVAARAGIPHIRAHDLRHAFADHVARHAGLRAAQALLGHASVNTTADVYTSRPDLDELAVSVNGLSYGVATPHAMPHRDVFSGLPR